MMRVGNRGGIPSAGHSCSDLRLVFRKEPGHPKVCYFGDPVVVEEDVASLYVPVDDTTMRILM